MSEYSGNITTCVIAVQPKPVGFWVLYAEAHLQTSFAMYHKPTDEQIENTERLLGWKWKDQIAEATP
jgi:hypothetical protein